jgi:LacI family transcriptional regulator
VRKRRSVALLIETSNAYARGLLGGIMEYVRQHQPWSIYLPELGRGDVPPRWRGDGIIARIETKAIARMVDRAGLPVVDVSAGRHLPSIPWLETDDGAITRLAVDHLLSRGFRHLAFCGESRFAWSRRSRRASSPGPVWKARKRRSSCCVSSKRALARSRASSWCRRIRCSWC